MRASTTCEQCGKTDDHPKVHIGAVTKHNDCLSFAEKAQVVEFSPEAAEIIAACEEGKRGPELLAHIEKMHESASEEENK